MAVLRIELLDDCNMNSGRVMNTYFLDDVFFDGFGIPYIPAWVIRNSLVRAIEQPANAALFSGLKALLEEDSAFILNDGVAADRESMRQALVFSANGKALLHNPQNILNASGLVKIKEVSSIKGAKYIRELAKGSIFEARFRLDAAYDEAFRNLIRQMRALYVGHEVRALFTIDEEWERAAMISEAPRTDFEGGRCRLVYDLYMISRMAVRNHLSGNLDSDSFLSGALIRDSLMNRAELKDIFLGGDRDVHCSYAYLSEDGRRFLPIPASYSTKKQDKTDLRDLCSLGRRPDDYDQIKGMGTLFINDPDAEEILAMDVRKEQGVFQYYREGKLEYQNYEAIAQGQIFRGFIEGPAEKIRQIYESLSADGSVHMGDLQNLGFGNTCLQVRSVSPVRKMQPQFVNEITVLLVSPARLYRNGLCEISAENIREEIERALGKGTELEIVRNSQKTCFLSNYNPVWKEFEPLEYGMQAGSVYRMRAKDGRPFDISQALGGIFIGAHNDAGYGETLVLPAVDIYYRKVSYADQPETGFPLFSQASPNAGRRLMRRIYQKNADILASYMGSRRAEQFVAEDFCADPLQKIIGMLGEDFDREEAFAVYMDAMKEYGLNAIRRRDHD